MAATKEDGKMSSGGKNLHICFLPFMGQGHMIPAVDMAKNFASRGIQTTIIATPIRGQFISKTIQKTKGLGFQIDVRIINFPADEVGLPESFETLEFMTSSLEPNVIMGMTEKIFQATAMMQESLESLLQELHPDCLVADMFFPWSTDSAAKFGIPRLVFHGTGFFSPCLGHAIKRYEPHMKVSSDSEPFLVPNLPGDIKMTTRQIREPPKDGMGGMSKVLEEAAEAELKSYGVVVNSFYELERDYADHYRNDLGRKAWHIGPVSLFNKEEDDKAVRGKETSIDDHECLKWLNSKKPNSVVYVCFGSMANFPASQLKKIALGLESSGQEFIWVVRRNQKDPSDWIPEGFEERIEGKGLIVRGWAPQLLILDHEAVGGFVSHCGWNSTVEGVAAGLPMVTWPMHAEQAYNEIFVIQVLKIGVGVGAAEKRGNNIGPETPREEVSDEELKDAVIQIMEGEKAEEMRRKARELGKMARRAVEEGGSSYSDMTALIEELQSRQG